MRMDLPAMDEWLAERCGMYTEWLDEGRIAYSSRVIPVGKSLPGRQWVLPTMQVNRIIEEKKKEKELTAGVEETE